MPNFIFIRHGQTDWNLQKRVMGWKDIDLNETGVAQINNLAKYLQGLKVKDIYTSRLKRAHHTASIVGEALHHPVVLSDHLMEFHFEEWEGLSREELIANAHYQKYRKDPLHVPFSSDHTILNVLDDAKALIDKILDAESNDDDIYVLVSHSGVIKLLLVYYLKLDIGQFNNLQVDNGSMSILNIPKNRRLTVAKCVNFIPEFRYFNDEV